MNFKEINNGKKNNKEINLDKILLKSIGNEKTLIFSTLIIIIAFTFDQIIFPKTLGLFIDSLNENNKFTNIKHLLLSCSPFIISQILYSCSIWLSTKTIPKIEFNILNEISSELLELLEYNNNNVNTTSLLVNINNIFEIKNIFNQITSYFVPTILAICGIIFYFFMMDLKTGLMVFCLFVIIIYIFCYLSNISLEKAKEKNTNVDEYLNSIDDMYENINSILTSGTKNFEIEKMKKNQNNIYNNYIGSELTSAHMKSIVSCMAILILIVLTGLMVNLYKQRKLSKGELVSVIFIIIILLQYYDGATYEIKFLLKSIGTYNSTKEYFKNFKHNILDNNAITNIDSIVSNTILNLNFVNVSVKFNDKYIFQNFNLTIKNNEKIAIYGTIGSGKTTLLKCVQQLVPYEGNIYIEKLNLNTINPITLRKHIGYVYQNPTLFNRTIYENISYGTNNNIQDIQNVIKYYGLQDFIMKFKEGLNTQVGKNGLNISGGQRQIILILRIIVQNKKILLFDEPTSSLDEDYKNILFNIIKKLNNKIIIIITHDDDLKIVVDRVINFNQQLNNK
jgi:ABC-type bacteriocin/lantibiotic exporter with double-glycine peptidase domain